MPNWCEGNIRVRGTYEQIVKFFSENVKVLIPPVKSKSGGYEEAEPKIERGPYCAVISKPDGEYCDEFYIKDTVRQFIDVREIELYDNSFEKGEITVICVEGYKSAWHIRAEDFIPMAKKYQVDIKLFGYDCGLEFMQWAEILKDGTVTEKVERFNDWNWECPRPNLGG